MMLEELKRELEEIRTALSDICEDDALGDGRWVPYNTAEEMYKLAKPCIAKVDRLIEQAEAMPEGWQDVRQAVYHATDYTGIEYAQKNQITDAVMKELFRLNLVQPPAKQGA
jgi:hypothetical protein